MKNREVLEAVIKQLEKDELLSSSVWKKVNCALCAWSNQERLTDEERAQALKYGDHSSSRALMSYLREQLDDKDLRSLCRGNESKKISPEFKEGGFSKRFPLTYEFSAALKGHNQFDKDEWSHCNEPYFYTNELDHLLTYCVGALRRYYMNPPCETASFSPKNEAGLWLVCAEALSGRNKKTGSNLANDPSISTLVSELVSEEDQNKRREKAKGVFGKCAEAAIVTFRSCNEFDG